MSPSSTDTQPTAQSAQSLADIRAEIDRLDDAIHDLLLARAGLVERLVVSGVKQGTPFRPGREASIMRRLLARHRGPFGKASLIGIWRELLVGMTAIQAPFSVVVWSPAPGSGHVALAREHFGTAVPIRWVRSTTQVLRAVALGEAQAGVLPMPVDAAEADGGAEPWWVSLLRGEASGISVVCRLPFVTRRPDGAPDLAALVVAPAKPESSGEDRSLVGFEGPAGMSRAALAELVSAAGFTLQALVTRRTDPNPVICLAEVDGLVAADDPRLAALERLGAANPTPLGAWPVPPPESAFAPSV